MSSGANMALAWKFPSDQVKGKMLSRSSRTTETGIWGNIRMLRISSDQAIDEGYGSARSVGFKAASGPYRARMRLMPVSKTNDAGLLSTANFSFLQKLHEFIPRDVFFLLKMVGISSRAARLDSGKLEAIGWHRVRMIYQPGCKRPRWPKRLWAYLPTDIFLCRL